MNAPKRRDDGEDWREVPQLRSLRRLVTALTAVLMIGVLAVAVTLVIRIAMEPPAAKLRDVGAEAVTLPEGEEIIAVGASRGALAIATRDDAGAERLRLFNPDSGAPTGAVRIERE